ncbi:helix-turn-helix domain-containing protein, partial [Enterococcus avium]|uniref:helix-turn-helix domain-containing protein n=1 Tax=Enterococcus avium TaxID=33945 RepID=UPI0022E3F8EC
INDETCFVFDGTLTYQPEECFHCHYENEQTIIKWGWEKVSILLNDVSNYKTILRINKQRFKCKHCGKTFLAEDSVSDRRCSIARRVKQAILELLSEPLSMSLIARMKHISPTTVIRIFKSVKNVSGAMSFVMMDGKTHQLIDIVENRQLNPLRDYFLRYPRKVREQV